MCCKPNLRLAQFLKHENIKGTEFAEMIGTSQPTVSAILSSKRALSRGMMARACDIFPQLNFTWLLTGEGEMLREVPEQNVEAQNGKAIPFYDAETTGGYDGYVASSDNSTEIIGYIQPGGWFDGRETAAIRHVGDSMTEYPNGCVLAVREVTDRHLLVPGRNYVIETSEYRVTKRVQLGSQQNCIALYSTNQERYDDGRLIHEPFEVPFEEIRRIYSVLGYIVNQSGEFKLIRP